MHTIYEKNKNILKNNKYPEIYEIDSIIVFEYTYYNN